MGISQKHFWAMHISTRGAAMRCIAIGRKSPLCATPVGFAADFPNAARGAPGATAVLRTVVLHGADFPNAARGAREAAAVLHHPPSTIRHPAIHHPPPPEVYVLEKTEVRPRQVRAIADKSLVYWETPENASVVLGEAPKIRSAAAAEVHLLVLAVEEDEA